MKRLSLTLLLVTALMALSGISVKAMTTGPGPCSVEIRGDYLPALSTFGVSGKVMTTDSQKSIFYRFVDLAKPLNAHVRLWLWSSLESISCDYDSFDAAVDAIVEYATNDAVCILYIADMNKAYAHVGEQVIPDYDTAKLVDILQRDKVVGEFNKLAGVFNALCADAGQATGKYATHVSMQAREVSEEEIREAMDPLHEVFSGYICIDYRATRHETFTSILRYFRGINYDEEYDLWEHEMDYYYKDAIYITYYGDTGDVFIDIGEDTSIKLSEKEIEKLESTFVAASDASDSSGFAAGVAALAEAVAASDEKGVVGTIAGISTAVVILLAVCTVVIVKKKC